MPNNATAKTKSAPKTSRRRLFFVAAGMLLLVVCATLLTRNNSKYVQIGSHQYATEVASTTAAQEQGLSSRTGMSARQAMLFTYSKPQQLCFWMKDMYFSLDILWLNADKRVVYMQQNVTPQTYPRAFCANAQYVLELRAGQVTASGAHMGQKIDF